MFLETQTRTTVNIMNIFIKMVAIIFHNQILQNKNYIFNVFHCFKYNDRDRTIQTFNLNKIDDKHEKIQLCEKFTK